MVQSMAMAKYGIIIPAKRMRQGPREATGSSGCRARCRLFPATRMDRKGDYARTELKAYKPYSSGAFPWPIHYRVILRENCLDEACTWVKSKGKIKEIVPESDDCVLGGGWLR